MGRRSVQFSLALALVASVALIGCGLPVGGTDGEGTPTAVTVPTLAAPLTPGRSGTPVGGAGGGASPTAGPGSAPTARPAATAASNGSSAPAAVPTAVPAGDGASDGGGEGKVYVVEQGDTLAVIAEKVYGDATLWQKIYDANKDAIGPNPDAIQIGMKLTVPP